MNRVVPTSDAMEKLGAALGAVASAGDVIVLTGELGAGKTTFARGFGEALGLSTAVSSPTFVVAREHSSTHGTPLVHIDAYRLGAAVELEDLDIDVENSIVLAEWARPFASVLSSSWLDIEIERPVGSDGGDVDSDQPRSVTITVHGDDDRYAKYLTAASS